MYSFIYRYLIYPCLYLTFRILALFNAKVKRALELRQSQNSKLPWLSSRLLDRPVWFHCASGEFEYAKPVISALKKANPNIKILLTYFSPSILESVEKFKHLDFFCPLPWDRPQVLKEFLTYYRPRALLIARTDAWPEMLTQAQEAKVPTLLFSATLASNSSRMNFLARNFTAWTLSKLSTIHCVSEDDFENFKILGLESKTHVCGDTRYDQVIDRLQNPKPIKDALFRHSPQEKIFVAGSSWPEDEDVLLQLVRSASKNYRFVIVPHEPTPSHIENLKKKFGNVELYSQVTTWKANTVLVVDQVGILAEIYAYANLAFVGGSFRKTVHSVMEPLAAGCLTFVGPKHQNNREALFMKKLDLNGIHPVIEVKNAKAFSTQLKSLEKKDLTDLSKEIRNLIEERAGEATEKILEWLAPHLV